MLRDVVDAHRAGRRRHRQPADLLDVAALVLEHADLDRVLLLRLPCRTRSGRRRTPRAAACCRSSTSARRDRRRACDRPRRGSPDSRRSGSASARRGSASSAPPPASSASSRPAAADRARGCSRDREAAGALAAAERVARGDARPVGRVRREPPPHLGDDLRLRLLALVDRQRLHEEVDVRRRCCRRRRRSRRCRRDSRSARCRRRPRCPAAPSAA